MKQVFIQQPDSFEMKAQINKQDELTKLKQLAPYPLDLSFINGYLTAIVPLPMVGEVKETVDQLFTMVIERLIPAHNMLQLLVFLKSDALMPEKVNLKRSLSSLVEPFLNELALDHAYLTRRYFQIQMPREEIMSESMGIECTICLTDINSKELSCLSCSHMFHRGCLNAYSKEKIINKEIPFVCPQEQCRTQITQEQLFQFLTADLKQKYDEFAFHNYVQQNMLDTSWCPTPGCSAVFTFDAALTDYKCPACNKHYCLACKCQFHTSLTCQEYKEMASLEDDDKKFMMLVKGAKFKQCPSCKFWVEKNEGCDHMTCRCKYEFCYVCGGKYNKCKCKGFVNQVEQPLLLGRAPVVPLRPPHYSSDEQEEIVRPKMSRAFQYLRSKEGINDLRATANRFAQEKSREEERISNQLRRYQEAQRSISNPNWLNSRKRAMEQEQAALKAEAQAAKDAQQEALRRVPYYDRKKYLQEAIAQNQRQQSKKQVQQMMKLLDNRITSLKQKRLSEKDKPFNQLLQEKDMQNQRNSIKEQERQNEQRRRKIEQMKQEQVSKMQAPKQKNHLAFKTNKLFKPSDPDQELNLKAVLLFGKKEKQQQGESFNSAGLLAQQPVAIEPKENEEGANEKKYLQSQFPLFSLLKQKPQEKEHSKLADSL